MNVACIACGHILQGQDFDKEKCVNCGFSLYIGVMRERIELAKDLDRFDIRSVVEQAQIWQKHTDQEKQREQN